jgi:pSer/pThr/pTyr-binding forkhead associated (FHA) protein
MKHLKPRMKMRLQLTAMATNDRSTFRKLPAIIGRDPSADVQVDDPMLPPYQCMIDKWGDGGVVWNLRDDFPLYVNNRRVTKTELSAGDIVNIGRNRFVFSCEPAPVHGSWLLV